MKQQSRFHTVGLVSVIAVIRDLSLPYFLHASKLCGRGAVSYFGRPKTIKYHRIALSTFPRIVSLETCSFAQTFAQSLSFQLKFGNSGNLLGFPYFTSTNLVSEHNGITGFNLRKCSIDVRSTLKTLGGTNVWFCAKNKLNHLWCL